MTLTAGTRLGSYEILSPLGEGGMGAVYKARDTRLDRTVAVKVLAGEIAGDADRRARFEREARAIAALNHPHICTLHDVGEHPVSATGPPLLYLVMEHVAGETLAARLARGPLPVAQAIDVASQVADALDAAHRQGIVHRDLKPANVMLTKGGGTAPGAPQVKLLDFGLARLTARETQGAVLGMSAMLTRAEGPVTAQGTIVGTLPYMAPEQLEGKPADARTDVWAFGAVLYEMLTGTPAFAGESAASLVGAILAKEPPPIATRQPLAPPALERLVKACLAKDPDERVQSAHDLVLELRWLGEAVAAPAREPRPRSRWRGWWGVAAAFLAGLALAAAAALSLVRSRETPPRRVVRFGIELPAGRAPDSLALSPDASHLAYVGVERERARVFLRALDQTTDQPVRGGDGGACPFFSPDGRWLAFFVGSKLTKVPVAGGDAVTIGDVPPLASLNAVMGAVWARDGAIVLGSVRTGIWRMPATGGTAVALTTPDPAHGESSHAWPALSRDGRHVLFTTIGGMVIDSHTVEAVGLDGSGRRMVLNDATSPVVLSAGYLLFGRGEGVSSVRLDASRLEALGDAMPAVDGVQSAPYRLLYTLSQAGDLAYVPANAGERATSIMRVDMQGRAEVIATIQAGLVPTLTLSPEGRRLLLTRAGRPWTLEALDIPRGVMTRVAAEGSPHAGVWSPDGERVLFSANPPGVKNANVFVQAAEAGGSAERLVTSFQHGDPASWSRDRRWVIYAELATSSDLWKLDMSTRKATPFRRTSAHETQPAISPDGRWLAYASLEANQSPQVFVEAFPDGGRRIQLSADSGREPVWAPDGRRLYYRSGDKLMSVSVETGSTLVVGPPKFVFEARFDDGVAIGPPAYAIAPDGQHFYFLRTPEPAPEPARINIVLGWANEFETRVGGASAR